MKIHNWKHPQSHGNYHSIPVLFGLVFVLLGILNPFPAAAQSTQFEKIQEYIDRNAELLDWAQDVVRETANRPATNLFETARSLHIRSIRLLEDDRAQMADNTAKRCRTAIRNSVRLARESMGYDERVRLRSERFRDQYSRLLEKAREANNQTALDFLGRSEVMSTRAYEQYQQGDARLAFKMLEQAEELMNRAGRMLAGEGGPERLENKIEMARMAVDRAGEKLMENANPAARKLLDESEHALGRALDFRDQGQPDRALQMANMAHRLANRAIGSADGGPGASSVQRQIERWDDRSERVTELVRETGNEVASRLLLRARNKRSSAAENLAREEYEPALRQIRSAHELLTQAEDLVR